MNTATIFFIDEQRLNGQDNPFGVRYEAAILPRGSVVVGFMKWDSASKSVQELIDAPVMTANQEQYWNELLEDARSTVSGNPVYYAVPVETGSSHS